MEERAEAVRICDAPYGALPAPVQQKPPTHRTGQPTEGTTPNPETTTHPAPSRQRRSPTCVADICPEQVSRTCVPNICRRRVSATYVGDPLFSKTRVLLDTGPPPNNSPTTPLSIAVARKGGCPSGFRETKTGRKNFHEAESACPLAFSSPPETVFNQKNKKSFFAQPTFFLDAGPPPIYSPTTPRSITKTKMGGHAGQFCHPQNLPDPPHFSFAYPR